MSPDCSVISLSDILPPTHSETNEIVPCGVILIKNFTVQWRL